MGISLCDAQPSLPTMPRIVTELGLEISKDMVGSLLRMGRSFQNLLPPSAEALLDKHKLCR